MTWDASPNLVIHHLTVSALHLQPLKDQSQVYEKYLYLKSFTDSDISATTKEENWS